MTYYNFPMPDGLDATPTNSSANSNTQECKLHWFCFGYAHKYGFGRKVWGFSDKEITTGTLLRVEEYLRKTIESPVIIGWSYMGFMSDEGI